MATVPKLTLDKATIAYDAPDDSIINMLREKGYADYDVQRLSKKLAAELQFSPDDPEVKDGIYRAFLRQFIVPSIASALFNEQARLSETPKPTGKSPTRKRPKRKRIGRKKVKDDDMPF